MVRPKKALKSSLDEIQQRINKYFETRASKRKEEQEEHERAIKMVKDAHDRGLTIREIASLFEDMHRSKVHRWLKEARQLEANNESTKSHLQSARELEAKKRTSPPE